MTKHILNCGDQPIHMFFGLSYANYLVLPRTALQTMPAPWQKRLVRLLEEMQETVKADLRSDYRVMLIDPATGRYAKDSLANYERGRRRLPLKRKAARAAKEKP